jgi:hypothetical protein
MYKCLNIAHKFRLKTSGKSLSKTLLSLIHEVIYPMWNSHLEGLTLFKALFNSH